MRKVFLFFVIITISCSSFAQVSHDELYDVINQVVKANKDHTLAPKAEVFPLSRLNEFIENSLQLGGTNSNIDLRTNVDMTYIAQQLRALERISWDVRRLDPAILIQKQGTHSYSIPLFLNDRKDLVLLNHVLSTGSAACCSELELYMKVGDQWKLIRDLPYDIS
jgi:hypothetical protein